MLSSRQTIDWLLISAPHCQVYKLVPRHPVDLTSTLYTGNMRRLGNNDWLPKPAPRCPARPRTWGTWYIYNLVIAPFWSRKNPLLDFAVAKFTRQPTASNQTINTGAGHRDQAPRPFLVASQFTSLEVRSSIYSSNSFPGARTLIPRPHHL